MFQEQISKWLGRSTQSRGLNLCYEMPFMLSTDVGLVRKENQDRTASVLINSRYSNIKPQLVVAVADGMGGMRDGAACAELALITFFQSLFLSKESSLDIRVVNAIEFANKKVYDFAGGKGGATISAFIVDYNLRPLLVNLGDSRVYSYLFKGNVERLTRDDSMREAVGGSGSELVQFVGMGEGMCPNVIPVPDDAQFLAITTDGVHSVESTVFEKVLVNSVDMKSAIERLTALSKWCGGRDNATIAMIDIQAVKELFSKDVNENISLWDPFGNLSVFLSDFHDIDSSDVEALSFDKKNNTNEKLEVENSKTVDRKNKENLNKNNKDRKKDKMAKGEQLNIEVFQYSEQGKLNDVE